MSLVTIKDFLNAARTDAYVNENQCDDAKVLRYFNITKNELENDLATFANDTFYKDGVYMNLVAWQKKYPLPSGTAVANTSVPQFKQLLQLTLEYGQNYPQNFVGVYNAWTAYNVGDVVLGNASTNNDTYFIALQSSTGQALTNPTYWSITFWPTFYKAQQQTFSNLQFDISWYDINQPYTNPFFMFDDNDIVIYPTPKFSVTNGFKLIYARSDVEVQLAQINTPAVVTGLTIPRQYHETIVKNMTYLIFKGRAKSKSPDAISALTEYGNFRQEMMKWLGQRFNQPEEWYLPPNLSNLMY